MSIVQDTSSNLSALIQEILLLNPLQRAFLASSLETMHAPETQALESYIRYCFSSGHDIPYLAACYDVIVKDTLREQTFFLRHRRYRHSSYEEVAGSVYQNPDYMQRYMHGLALTSYLWPNHREICRFFCSVLPRNKSGSYLEVGPGHGLFLMSAMTMASFNTYEAIDLSQTSIQLTDRLLQSGLFGKFPGYQLHCRDFLGEPLPRARYDAIVMGEVLEHVEKPLLFLQRIRSALDPQGFAFVTTAINAPAIDHIYLFDSVTSVENLVRDARLRITESLVVPYAGKNVAESVRERLPINIALALSA